MFLLCAVAERMPCLSLCLCPIIVGISCGRYFDTRSADNPGNVEKLPFLIALIQVLFAG